MRTSGLNVLSLVGLLALGAGSADAAAEVKLDGYAEWRLGNILVVDGQRVTAGTANLKLKGAQDFASIPLGFEVRVTGERQADGSIRATQIDARPNAGALFEGLVKSATDEAEDKYRRAGSFFEEKESGGLETIGRLYDSGPRVDRVREIVDRLVPPYVAPEDVRVYVIENKEWNAFAMGNFSIYVFSGLLKDMDDDELAIILGHEIAHATHEHTRRTIKKEMWVQLAALGVAVGAESIDNKTQRAAVQIAAQLGALAWSSGYGRKLEDQADRVGMRYAYEAGYDIRRGPELWERFAKKYGNGNKVVDFFFSDHSQSRVRAAHMREELGVNYAEGPKAQGPAMASRRTRPADTKVAAVETSDPEPPVRAIGFADAGSLPGHALADGGFAGSLRVKKGMTSAEVREVLGDADEEVAFGALTKWAYEDLSVIFERGRVKEVQFE